MTRSRYSNDMYNKIFTKILDSSIWLEADATRLVWLTLIAAMDEDGFAQFASVPNLARRAIVSVEATEEAVHILEAPDPNSSDPDNDGRRIERVPGGWMILNACKYREIVTREIGKERTRIRVARHRKKKKAESNVTIGNDSVTPANDRVTQSEAYTDTDAEAQSEAKESLECVELQGGPGEVRSVAPKRARRASTQQTDETFIASLKANAAYEGIDVDRELGKAQSWCLVHRRQCNAKFFVNWLNRVDRPMGGNNKIAIGDVEVDLNRFSSKTRGNAAVMARFVNEGKTDE